MSKFNVVSEKGFQITFENGLTISVMFGAGNYCQAKNSDYPINRNFKVNHESVNCEIAIWDESGKWFSFKNDQVIGWISTDETADIIHAVKNAKNLEDLGKNEIIKKY